MNRSFMTQMAMPYWPASQVADSVAFGEQLLDNILESSYI